MFLMDFNKLSEQFNATLAENEMLRESYTSMAQAVIAFDDAGWNPAGTPTAEGFTLTQLRDIASKTRENTEGNPLLKRGSGLRTSYIFGRGIQFSEQPPRIKRFMELQQNQDVLFSPEA
jgi:hypothetical protein